MTARTNALQPLPRRTEWLLLAFLVALTCGLRLWALGDKGLAYDEAATALMARATPAEIIYFHWDAAFEHPPLWQLTMYCWSQLAGQREAMLRLLPALAGVLAVPLTWRWLRTLWPARAALRLLAAGLVATSPVLVLYSQEARMYTVVVVLALLSLLAAGSLVERPRVSTALLFVLANWLMVGYHYYSLLVVAIETLFFVLVVWWQRRGARCLGLWLGAAVVSLIPIGLWMAFAPGFGETVTIIVGGLGRGGPPATAFFHDLWRDLSFGAIRWQPESALWGYLLLAPVLLGLGWLVADAAATRAAIPWGWLMALLVLLPLAVSTAFFRSLATRYLLFVTPALYVSAAGGILWLWRRHAALGALGLAAVLAVALLGLGYYFGPYHKSEYREMAAFLRTQRGPDDAVMLYAPRQHLLAKYYLPAGWAYVTAPAIELPAFWPLTAPRVVPEQMDGEIQDALRRHPALWLVMTAQDEVDPGEFVPKYLTAVAYKEDCWAWLDVQLCHFVSPHFAGAGPLSALDVLFNRELRLQRAGARVVDDTLLGRRYILAELDWLAERKPTIDYRVTLRLLDRAGQVVAQRDEFPIGTLLPPTTWNPGDAKPGYLALPLPADLPADTYTLVVGLYDPVTGIPIGDMVKIATIP